MIARHAFLDTISTLKKHPSIGYRLSQHKDFFFVVHVFSFHCITTDLGLFSVYLFLLISRRASRGGLFGKFCFCIGARLQVFWADIGLVLVSLFGSARAGVYCTYTIWPLLSIGFFILRECEDGTEAWNGRERSECVA